MHTQTLKAQTPIPSAGSFRLPWIEWVSLLLCLSRLTAFALTYREVFSSCHPTRTYGGSCDQVRTRCLELNHSVEWNCPVSKRVTANLAKVVSLARFLLRYSFGSGESRATT